MSFSGRAISFVILTAVICANVTLAGDEANVEQMPNFTEYLNLSGEQAEALTVAIGELKREKLSLKQYVIRIEQADNVFAVIFNSPSKKITEIGSPADGPPGFEVTVCRPSMTVMNAHYMR